jgi:hypothetical protein
LLDLDGDWFLLIGNMENDSFIGKKDGIFPFLSLFRRFLLFFLFDKMENSQPKTQYIVCFLVKNILYIVFLWLIW